MCDLLLGLSVPKKAGDIKEILSDRCCLMAEAIAGRKVWSKYEQILCQIQDSKTLIQ